MSRSVLVTGSEGYLGRALCARFRSLGYDVCGVDKPGTDARVMADLDAYTRDCERHEIPQRSYDVVICNAKLRNWEYHHALAGLARSAVVNVASIYGVLGNDPSLYTGTEVEPTPAWYSASKGALIALTRWQATNLAPVRSNVVCPGGIFRGHSDVFRERYEAKVPLGRMATESDIVNAVVFLADETQSGYITGQILCVDGGLTAMA